MSNYALAQKFRAEPLRTVAFGSISGTYTGIGTAFANPARQIYVLNLTNQTLVFSLDGVNDHFKLPTMGFLLLDVTSNKTQLSGFYAAEGDRWYVKSNGVNPSSGEVDLSVFFGSTGY